MVFLSGRSQVAGATAEGNGFRVRGFISFILEDGEGATAAADAGRGPASAAAIRKSAGPRQRQRWRERRSPSVEHAEAIKCSDSPNKAHLAAEGSRVSNGHRETEPSNQVEKLSA